MSVYTNGYTLCRGKPPSFQPAVAHAPPPVQQGTPPRSLSHDRQTQLSLSLFHCPAHCSYRPTHTRHRHPAPASLHRNRWPRSRQWHLHRGLEPDHRRDRRPLPRRRSRQPHLSRAIPLPRRSNLHLRRQRGRRHRSRRKRLHHRPRAEDAEALGQAASGGSSPTHLSVPPMDAPSWSRTTAAAASAPTSSSPTDPSPRPSPTSSSQAPVPTRAGRTHPTPTPPSPRPTAALFSSTTLVSTASWSST
jgi:hypothetical protein